MKRSISTWTAWTPWTLSLCLIASSIVLQVAVHHAAWGTTNMLTVLGMIAFTVPATVGALVTTHHPRNAIGWLFGVASLAWVGAGQFVEVLSRYLSPDSPPGWDWVVWGFALLYLPSVLATVTFLFLLFPDGQLPGTRWRPLAWFAALLIAWIAADEAFTVETLVEDPVVENPARIAGAEQIFRHDVLETSVLTLFTAVLALSAAALFLRLRDSRGIERQQLKWFAFPTIAIAVIMVGAVGLQIFAGDDRYQLTSHIVFAGTMAAAILLPVTVAIAIIRHNLYDIDRLINRTLVYGLLTATLLATYFAIVLGVGGLVREGTGESSPVVVAASTLAVAGLFRPLRSRIQSLVDRRFYRHKYDAGRALEAFGVTARDAVALDQLIGELNRVVSTTMQPSYVSVWLRTPIPGGRS